MTKLRFVQAAALAAAVVILASCSTGRVYDRGYYSRPQTGVSLILGPVGLAMSRDPYGRYYYRDPYGHTYWRGYDNRFYLDRKYVDHSYLRHEQYNDWKRYHDNGRRRR